MTVLHSRKSAGSITETIAGSVAVAGEADHIVRVRRSRLGERVRNVDTEGRLADPEDMHLASSPEHVWSYASSKPSAGSPAGGESAGGEPADGPSAPAVMRNVNADSVAARVEQVLRDAKGADLLPEEVVGKCGFPTLKTTSVMYALRALVKRGTASKRTKPNSKPTGRSRVTYCISPSRPRPL